MQNTVKLFQFPVFNYYMLTENSGKTGISSLFFAHIFQIMQDILTGIFFLIHDNGPDECVQRSVAETIQEVIELTGFLCFLFRSIPNNYLMVEIVL